jgi:hypothetical protein
MERVPPCEGNIRLVKKSADFYGIRLFVIASQLLSEPNDYNSHRSVVPTLIFCYDIQYT